LTLLITSPGRLTWLEDSFPSDMRRIFAEFRANPALLQIKDVNENPKAGGGGCV